MNEITSTRLNHLVDPTLHVWAWQIPVYLFLGGLVAGLMVLMGFSWLRGGASRLRSLERVLPALALVLLSAGMFALFLDLENRFNAWRLYLTFQPGSPMSWGAWILLAVYPALAVAMLLEPPVWLVVRFPGLRAWSERLREHAGLVRATAVANVVLGGALGIYTGILLSSLGARPAWSSAMLGPLFLTSGLSSAAALGHLLTREAGERHQLGRADHRFLQAKLVILALYLLALASSSRVHKAAASLFLGGPYTAVFWVGIVGIGIAVPLFLQSRAVAARVRHDAVGPLLVMGGGLLLRAVFVSAGQWSHWGAF